MNKHNYYSFSVGGHCFYIMLPHSYDINELLPTFTSFRTEYPYGRCCKKSIFSVKVITSSLSISQEAVLLSTFSGAFGDMCSLYESDQFYEIAVRYTPDGIESVMRVSRDFGFSEIYIDPKDCYKGSALSFFLMFTYAQRSVQYGTFLLHASVIVNDGIGYAFLGKSGTGKSTHSQLWLKYLDEARLLNDDNPAIHVCRRTNTVYVSGTPWSGKTPCYKNETVKLGAFIRLVQHEENEFQWLNEFDAFVNILPGCSSLRWNNDMYSSLCNLLEDVVKVAPTGILRCLPHVSAMELCYQQINNSKI